MTSATRFDLTGELPTGTAVLEASAGTGKTFTIAGLVVRYVAAGHDLPRLLVVTFTRAATAELRDRVRTRLVEVGEHLERRLDGLDRATPDRVASLLADGSRDEVHARYRNIAAALTEFDAATIATIHGFCQNVLQSVGLAGDVDRDADLLESESEIIEAVVDDLLVRRFHAGGDGPNVTRSQLLDIAEAVVGNPDATIIPDDPEDPGARLRVDLAGILRAEVDHRKRAASLLSYNDLLTRLRDTLRDEVRGAAARRRLREQYHIALIDEFQDTDPIQWDILSAAFGESAPGDGGVASGENGDASRALVLIGDPKQAIYSFRGADVHAYLWARGEAHRRYTLDVNWRSDGDLLTAFNRFFSGAALGHRDILYRDVQPTPAHEKRRLLDAPNAAPLRLRIVPRHETLRVVGKHRTVQADAARQHIARDLAAEIVNLLESGARIVQRDTDGNVLGDPDPVKPEHLAVLTRMNAEASLVQKTLRDAGVPAVINGVGSVFATAAASDWLRLLEALERPASPTRARAAALSAFLGWTAEEVATDDEDRFEELHETLHRWAAILRDRDGGVASLLRTIALHERLSERLLSRRDGERLLTDIEHIGELLHAAATAEELGGVSGLSAWLRERMAEAEEEVESDERARRLESDAEAVQVLTIHRSKGLEFPVVYCPFLWSPGRDDVAVPVFHDDEIARGRIADVSGGSDPEYGQHVSAAKREHHGENLRLLYVALTRAKHQAIVWWAPVGLSEKAPLTRMLFCRGRDGTPVTQGSMTSVPKDEDVATLLRTVEELGGGTIGIGETPPDPQPGRWQPDERGEETLEAARFERELDRRWRRTSYSSLTAAAYEPLVGSEHGEAVKDDEALHPAAGGDGEAGRRPAAVVGTAGAAGAGPAGANADEARLRDVVLPLGEMPGGTAIGTFVHAVLEETDFAAEDLETEVRRAVDEQRERSDVAIGDEDDLVAGLVRAVETPLGPLVDDLRLRDVAEANRLDEMGFELPLAGGGRPRGAVSVAAIADLLDSHLVDDDPLAGYSARLRDPGFQVDVRGYLTGSIDLLLRVPGDGDGHGRFVVVDHKTNRLAPAVEALTAWHYRPEALADAMRHGHYPLQALLYAAATHRYLRWRLPGYDPVRHLGGVLYLFVRGMTGADVPRVPAADGQPCGVFAWRPPASLVVALSDLLDRGKVAA